MSAAKGGAGAQGAKPPKDAGIGGTQCHAFHVPSGQVHGRVSTVEISARLDNIPVCGAETKMIGDKKMVRVWDADKKVSSWKLVSEETGEAVSVSFRRTMQLDGNQVQAGVALTALSLSAESRTRSAKTRTSAQSDDAESECGQEGGEKGGAAGTRVFAEEEQRGPQSSLLHPIDRNPGTRKQATLQAASPAEPSRHPYLPVPAPRSTLDPLNLQTHVPSTSAFRSSHICEPPPWISILPLNLNRLNL